MPKREEISDTLTQTSYRSTQPTTFYSQDKFMPMRAPSQVFSVHSEEELKEETPAFAKARHENYSFTQCAPIQTQRKTIRIAIVPKKTQKTIMKSKPNRLDFYKEKCKAKNDLDMRKVAVFNEKFDNGTITRTERQQRINLLRQINSRNYRVHNKELIQRQKAFIDFTVKYAEENNLKSFLEEYRKLKDSDAQLEEVDTSDKFDF